MWLQLGDEFVLSPKEDVLKKWLPSLSTKQSFCFRPDIEVEWIHEWPIERFSDKQIIFFLRDPRDALYSRYKRESPKVSFSEFLNFLDPTLLLNKMEINLVFTKMWRRHPQCRVFNFEDYKRDPETTLRNILNYINIDVSDAALSDALGASSSNKAAEIERRWNEENEIDGEGASLQVINQGGIVGRWEELMGADRVLSDHVVALKSTINSPDNTVFSTYLYFLKKNNLLKGVPFHAELSANPQEVIKLESRALSFAGELQYPKALAVIFYPACVSHLLKTLAALAYEHNPSVLRNIEQQYQQNIGAISQLYLGIFRRTGRVFALLHCNPFYILKLMVKKHIVIRS